MKWVLIAVWLTVGHTPEWYGKETQTFTTIDACFDQVIKNRMTDHKTIFVCVKENEPSK